MGRGTAAWCRLLRRSWLLLLPWFGICLSRDAAAQSAPDTVGRAADPLPQPDRIISLGQPPRFKPYLAGMFSWVRDSDPARIGGDFTAGVYRDLSNPIVGALGIAVEGNIGWADEWSSGVRVLGRSPALALGIGAEFRFGEGGVDLLVSFTPPLLRGGPFGHGGALRVDWIPTRDHSWRLGLTMPVAQPWMGKTRPRASRVALPHALNGAPDASTALLGADVDAALVDASRAAAVLTHFTYGFFDNSGGSDIPAALARFRATVTSWRDTLREVGAPDGTGAPTFARVEERYHAAVDRAFALAAAPADPGAARTEIADAARAILLEEVLLPYNRLIGQTKSNDSLRGLYPAANARFERWLADHSSGLDAAARQRVLQVFGRLLDLAERNRARIHDFWRGDSRQVWLPLQFALRPEQHDSQEELDTLIDLAVGRPFTSGNLVLPINSTWFARDLITSLHAAEHYHVLWLHDYRGVNDVGAPDTIGFLVSVRGYLGALTDAVRRYDERGALPSFFIFLDQNGYEAHGSRLWMTLLEDPLGHPPDLPGAHRAMKSEIEAAQRELRAAVAASPRLQHEAELRGADWLRSVIKVHVSVTYPADFSFRSSQLVSWMPWWLPILPDELMRDHRKIAFYDVTEQDPRIGRAIFTGTGVGEHYASPTWEDRGVAVVGPALVGLKDAARQQLLDLGFAPNEIPAPLRPLPRPPNYDSLAARLEHAGADAHVLNVHNQVGFAPKHATLLQALLYTLMPSGCIIYVPDPLWLSGFWAGQLVGAAFRGCDVRIIAPALANAPITAKPVMARGRALVTRLFEVQELLQDAFADAGGSFRIGLYTNSASVNDLPAMLREMVAQFDEAPFLRDDFPFPDSVYGLLAGLPDFLSAHGFQAKPLVTDTTERQTKLHRKTQLLGMRSVLREIARELDVETMGALLIDAASRMARPDSVPGDLRSQMRALEPLISRISLLPDSLRERSVLYALVGSMNKDARSMMLDGETLLAVSGRWGLVQYLDYALLAGRTTWLHDRAQVDELLPPYSTFDRWLGRLLRDLF